MNPELMIQIEQHLGGPVSEVRIYADTSSFFGIERGDVLELDGRSYLIMGTMRESGFGLDDEPKYWVKRAVDCRTGALKIIKLVFLEQFTSTLGDSQVRCFRSPVKEARVLDKVRRHPQFMTGFGIQDTAGNHVRVIDFIQGTDLKSYTLNFSGSHEAYFHEQVPMLLWRLLPSLQGLQFLHEQNERHGDVRPDHILVDDDTGLFRWIDFDYEFDHREAPFTLDILGVGNILAMIIGKGAIDSYQLEHNPALAGVIDRVDVEDLSIVHRGRLMNLRKAYPYIPNALNRVLLHFSTGAEIFYESMAELIEDLGDALSQLMSTSIPGETV